jgi:hypothetical protein
VKTSYIYGNLLKYLKAVKAIPRRRITNQVCMGENFEREQKAERQCPAVQFNLLAPKFYIKILAHPVCKM